jgi:KDO2-lipid IV(A) lauroyltransferase
MSPFCWIEFFVVRFLAAFLQAVPFPVALRWGRMFGTLVYLGSPTLRRRVRENLRIAFGDDPEAAAPRVCVQKVFESVGLHAAELSQMLRRGRRGFTLENGDLIREAHRQGRGVVLVSAHLGCFVKLVLVPGILGLPASVIMKRQTNQRLQDWVVNVLSRRFGVDVLLKKEAGDQLGDELRRGRLVGFFADQRPRGGGVSARFFGREVEVPRGPAVCAKRYGAPVIVLTLLSRSDGTHVARCEGPLSTDGSLEDISRRWIGVVESRIREHPEQWMWMHRRWR